MVCVGLTIPKVLKVKSVTFRMRITWIHLVSQGFWKWFLKYNHFPPNSYNTLPMSSHETGYVNGFPISSHLEMWISHIKLYNWEIISVIYIYKTIYKPYITPHINHIQRIIPFNKSHIGPLHLQLGWFTAWLQIPAWRWQRARPADMSHARRERGAKIP